MSALGAGVLVGVAALLALDRGGRPARTAQLCPGAGLGAGGMSATSGRGVGGVRASPPDGAVRGVGSLLSRRRRSDDRRLVLVVIAQVTALLRAGAAPGRAWEQAAGVPSDAAGVPIGSALAPVVGGQATARAVVAACRLAADVGAPLVDVLDQVGRSVVAEAEARADRGAALGGPRATARVLGWLPVAGVVLGMMLGVDPIASAIDGGIGTLGLLLGALFQAAGRWWTRLLLARAQAEGERE